MHKLIWNSAGINLNIYKGLSCINEVLKEVKNIFLLIVW